METLFGFKFSDLTSWKKVVTLLHQPKHGSILAYTRIAFGLLMMIDIPQERGMFRSDSKYADEFRDVTCRFPYFSALQPLSGDFMVLLYAMLFINSVGILFGLFYRLNCISFNMIYWYFFLLDKSRWNNHSYLYGLLGFLFLVTDSHRYMSIDGLLRKRLRNSHVPLWNYTLLRFQIFLVYFYAGLKKTDMDWLTGYSMNRLTKHWVFDPMRLFMSDSTMDLVIVHYGGFILDSSAGFLFFFDKTRYIGFMFVGMFHAMNSQLFSIGMFPYAMIATMFVFCHDQSFKNLIEKFPGCTTLFGKVPVQRNDACVYKISKQGSSLIPKIRWKQTLAVIFTLLYVAEQLFLPFSHFITKGYNGWTEGPYGYSWDMMVHSYDNQHIKITYIDKHGEEGYLKPGTFLQGSGSRWSTHPDMTIQYARCIKDRLEDLGIEEPSIYFDVWKSLNRRFQQRAIDPRVDLANYDWSPFKFPTFVLPVLSDLTPWRSKLKSMRKEYNNRTLDVVFVADFPGMSLENFVHKDFGNTSIEVLHGNIVVNAGTSNENITLSPGESMQVPPGAFHTVATTSSTPSCYFYIYNNQTDQTLHDRVDEYRRRMSSDANADSVFSTATGESTELDDPHIVEIYRKQEARRTKEKIAYTVQAKSFILKKSAMFRRSFLLSYYAARNVIVGRPEQSQLQMENLYLDWFTAEHSQSPSNGDEPKEKKSLDGEKKTEL